MGADQGSGTACGGDGADQAPGEGGQDQPRTTSKEGEHDLARHPDHHRGPHPGRPGCCRRRNGASARLSRSRRAPPHHAQASGAGAGPTPQRQRREDTARDHARRGQGHAEQTRAALPTASRPSRPAAPADQPTRGQQTRRLPLARPTTSPSSSTATATTTPATPGNKTAAASERRTPATTKSAATPTRDVYEDPEPMLAELETLLASPPAPTGAEASSTPRSRTSSAKRRSASAARS